jgi:integrase
VGEDQFPTVSKTGHRDYMKKQFARTLERAGLDPHRYTPHTMRHALIMRLIEAGHSAEQIQKISGHKTIQMVLHYTHIADSAVGLVLDSVDLL